MHPALQRLGEDQRRLLERAKPRLISPMKATLHKGEPPRGEWLYEHKYDGVRAVAVIEKGAVNLYSRTARAMPQYPEIAEALPTGHNAVLDGEIIAPEDGGHSFSRLQGRMQLSSADAGRRSGIPIEAYFFDIMHLDGYDLTRLPLTARREVLQAFLPKSATIHLSQVRSDGEAFLTRVCKEGGEGAVAKRPQSRYQERRSTDWLKLKCTQRQEFVIAGYTEPRGSRQGFGALLLGYYDEQGLRYAGKVGTGFDDAALARLSQRLKGIPTSENPFVDETPKAMFVEPRLVGEVRFTEWTDEGRLRHPSFLGLRDDKPAEAVVRE